MKPPPIPASVAEHKSRLGWLFLAACLCGSAVLYAFDPSHHGFYPRCWFYLTTGWQCPGCGGLRAAHCLLHGRIADALRFNPLFVCLLPVGGYLMLDRVVRLQRGLEPRRINTAVWLWLLGGIVFAFGIVRNLI